MTVERNGKVCIFKYTGPEIIIQEGNRTMPGHEAIEHHNGFITMPPKSCEELSPLLQEKIDSHVL